MTDQAEASARRLFEMVDAAKRLLGDDYEAKIGPIIEHLAEVSEKAGCSPLEAASDAARESASEAFTVMVMAAAVELVIRKNKAH